MRICLWSGPRNISTALMYSFAQRADTCVVDEPLYAHYLTARPEQQARHPSAGEILAAQHADAGRVVAWMLGPQPRPVAFFKQMTHHLTGVDRGWLAEVRNVILTRDPRDMLPSYDAVIEQPTLADVGYADHTELAAELDARGIDYAVVDSRRVLEDPAKQLGRLCDWLGLPRDTGMLAWEAGARAEDGVWAPHWYASVHRSTGFAPYRPKTEPLAPHLHALYEEALPHYRALLARAL